MTRQKRGLRMDQMGQALPAILFFLFGFSVLIAGVYVWQKKDDNAFEKANASAKDLRADIMTELGHLKVEAQKTNLELDEVAASIRMHADEQKEHDSKTHKRLEAIELDLTRVKDRQASIKERLLPHLHTITLKQDAPLSFELIRKVIEEKPKEVIKESPGGKTQKTRGPRVSNGKSAG